MLELKLNHVPKWDPSWRLCNGLVTLNLVLMGQLWSVICEYVLVIFNHVIFLYHHSGCLNSLSFSNLGLCAACEPYFMHHHELWPASVNHPFSSVTNSLGLVVGKYYQKIIIPIIRVVLQNYDLPGCFPYILFYCYLFSLLSSGWFLTV